jgi:hypothetical protein
MRPLSVIDLSSTKEFQGKLSLARAKRLEIKIEGYRQTQARGITVRLEILATPGCTVAEAQSGKTYGIENLPVLPILGCDSEHGCGCFYNPCRRPFGAGAFPVLCGRFFSHGVVPG